MAKTFTAIIISLIVFAVFAISFINGGMILAENNNGQSITQDPSIGAYVSALNSSLESSYQVVNDSDTSLSESPITTTSVNPFFDAVGGIWKVLKGGTIAIYNITVGLVISKLFAGSQAALIGGVVSAILMLMLIAAVIRLVSGGEA